MLLPTYILSPEFGNVGDVRPQTAESALLCSMSDIETVNMNPPRTFCWNSTHQAREGGEDIGSRDTNTCVYVHMCAGEVCVHT